VVQVGVGDEIALYILSQDLIDGEVEYACVYCPLYARVDRACVQTYIIVASCRSHHIGGEIAFVETTSYTKRDNGEGGLGVQTGGKKGQQQA